MTNHSCITSGHDNQIVAPDEETAARLRQAYPEGNALGVTIVVDRD